MNTLGKTGYEGTATSTEDGRSGVTVFVGRVATTHRMAVRAEIPKQAGGKD